MVTLHVTAKPKSGRSNQLESTLRSIVKDALGVQGCVKYEWYRVGDKDSSFVVYGEFDDRESFNSYRNSNVVKRIGREILPLLESKPAFKHFEAELFESG